jgi:restriction system protein
MTRYSRIMSGRGSVYADQCISEGFVGVDWVAHQDLTGRLPEDWREFSQIFTPLYLEENPSAGKIAAGLARGMTWTVLKGLQEGDVVMTPDGKGNYKIGKIVGDYLYVPSKPLPHRRPVDWLSGLVPRSSMTKALQNSIGSIGTVSECSNFADEIDGLIQGKSVATEEVDNELLVDPPTIFAMEKYLEEFLFSNWPNTELGKKYDLYSSEETSGRQVSTDAGIIDLLAISKDQNEYLVIELKRGRASDEVVGQVTRYMGYMQTVASPGQRVKGLIIALEDDSRIQHSLRVVPNVDFYKYEIDFRLKKI